MRMALGRVNDVRAGNGLGIAWRNSIGKRGTSLFIWVMMGRLMFQLRIRNSRRNN